MKPRTLLALLTAFVLTAGVPALADEVFPTADNPATARMKFANAASAARFAEAVRVVVEQHAQRSQLDLRVEEDGALLFEGPGWMVRQIRALSGVKAPAQATRGPRQGRAKAKDKARGPRKPAARPLEVGVFELTHADASRVVDYIDMLRVGSRAPWEAIHDDRTNSIIVKGPADLIEQASQLIERLDRPGRAPWTQPVVKLMPLSHADALELADVVRHISRQAMRDIEAVPDQRTNVVVLAGPEEQVIRAAKIIERLDIKAPPAAGPKKVKPAKAKQGAKQKRGKKHAKRFKPQTKPDGPTQKKPPSPKSFDAGPQGPDR
ncbi:MAG: secretin N-terminal domain-containing protein [Phycisphaerae bacterium]